jgi:hypothetical protein
MFFLDDSGAAERARLRALQGLSAALERGVDVRPCPKCGHIQEDMVAAARRRHLGWMSLRTLFLVLLLDPGVANGKARDVPLTRVTPTASVKVRS